MLVCSVNNLRLVRINKPANLCVVVSRIEVVEARFGIVVITSVTERVVRAERRSHWAACREYISPRVILVSNDNFTGSIQYRDYIAVNGSAEEIIVSVITKTDYRTRLVIILNNVSVAVFAYYLRAVKLVSRSYAVDGLLLCKNLYNQNATPRKFLFTPNPFSAFFFFLFLIIFSWFF